MTRRVVGAVKGGGSVTRACCAVMNNVAGVNWEMKERAGAKQQC